MPRTEAVAAIGSDIPLLIESSATELREIATARTPMVATRHAERLVRPAGARFPH